MNPPGKVTLLTFYLTSRVVFILTGPELVRLGHQSQGTVDRNSLSRYWEFTEGKRTSRVIGRASITERDRHMVRGNA